MKPIPKVRRAGLLLITAFLFCAAPARAQEQSPIEFPVRQIASHRIGTLQSIRGEGMRFPFNAIKLEVVVSPEGKVESAKAISGRGDFFDQAEAIEMKRQFKPFEQDGIAVRASITDAVSVYPPEKWAKTKIPFPEIHDWNSLRITFKQAKMCDGGCLSYSVEIRGDGSVTFHGGPYALITGEHHATIPKDALANLVNEFRRADYFSLKKRYEDPMSDQTGITTSIECDGNRKQVFDYLGFLAGMPDALETLEAAINQAAGTGKWLKETDETWPSLVAENWNFAARTEENTKLLASVVNKGSSELRQNFIANGAPTDLLDDVTKARLDK
jgi:Domain of unknown function (DUF6438)